MITQQNIKTFPFTEKHFEKFRRELIKAGNFDNLMLKKNALKRIRGMKHICLYQDIDGYRKKHLKGVYRTLRETYDTEMPYVFWSNLNKLLSESEAENK